MRTFFVLTCLGTSVGFAQSVGFGTRPVSVPSDFDVTPNGYFHPTCIVEVPNEGFIDADGSTISPAGVRTRHSPCAFPHFDRAGNEVPRDSVPGQSSLRTPGTVPFSDPNGYVVYAYDNVPKPTWVSATWTVPTAPIGGSSVNYFFNAIEPDGTEYILQPVLAWNQSYSAAWSVTPWRCCVTGTTFHGTGVYVHAGDTIQGYMYPSGPSGTCTSDAQCGTGGVCVSGTCHANFYIGINVNGSYATGMYAPQGTATFNNAFVFGGAFEVYSVNYCNQLASSGYEYFSNQSVYSNGSPYTPNYDPPVYADPICNVAAYTSASTISMYWTYTL